VAQGAIIARIVSQYSEKGSKAAQKDIAKLNKKFDLMGKRALLAANAASAAFVALSIKIGKNAVRAAVDDAKSQALLANTLRNTTGASAEQVKAVEAQIAALSESTGVLDDELRPSLQKFLTLTKDIEKAQFLQGIAVQLAAHAQVDVATATDVLAKAYRGQFKGLQNLGIALDENIVKNKDVASALQATMDATKGATDAANDADPFKKLNRDLQEMYETLGAALLPVITEFVGYLRTTLIPELTNWINLNKDELQASLRGIADYAKRAFEAAIMFDKGLRAINLSLPQVITHLAQILALFNLMAAAQGVGLLMKEVAALRYGTMVAGTAATVTASAYQTTLGTALASTAAKATTWTVFLASMSAKLGKLIPQGGMFAKVISKVAFAFRLFWKLTPISKLFLLYAGFVAVSKAIGFVKDKLFGTDEVVRTKVVVPMQNAQQATIDYFNAWTERTVQQKKDAEILAQIAKDKAAADKRAAQEARVAAIKAQIAKKFGVKLLDEETRAEVDAKAILYNLERGKQNAQAEIIKQQLILKEINKAALEEEIKLRTRLQDILKAYSDDQKVDIVEVGILAKMWGTTSEAAALYVDQILAVADQKISDDEVNNLSIMWGISKDQAAKYLDFVKAVSDGKISDAEINNLASKWNMTKLEVMKYADFIIAVQDRDLNDEEVQRLKDKWGLTNEQVADYILAIGAPVKYTGTILDPDSIKKLEQAWLAALAALIKYKNALGNGGFNNLLPDNTDPNAPGNDPKIIADANAAAAAAAAAAADAAAALAESEAALAAAAAASSASAAKDYALAKLIGDRDSMAAAAARVNPSTIAQAESGAIGAASIAAQLAAAERQLAFDRNMATYAAFQQKERADAAAAAVASATTSSVYDWDERLRISNMSAQSSTLTNAKGITGGNLMAAPVVNVTVQGSVTSEQDLVTAVRNGLLATQYNGNQISLQAV
jgi:hypothetical protein